MSGTQDQDHLVTLLLVGKILLERLTLLENNCYFRALFPVFSYLLYPGGTSVPPGLRMGRQIPSSVRQSFSVKSDCTSDTTNPVSM